MWSTIDLAVATTTMGYRLGYRQATRHCLVVPMLLILAMVNAFVHQQQQRTHSHHRRHTLSMKIDYRNAKETDIESVSNLCADIFDGPFEWHQQLARIQSVGKFKTQFQQSMGMVQQGIKHAMIVAVEVDDGSAGTSAGSSSSSSVVGFMEVGMLPCPFPDEDDESSAASSADAFSVDDSVQIDQIDPTLVESPSPSPSPSPSSSIWDEAAADVTAAAPTSSQQALLQEGSSRRAVKEVPFLGTVAVLQVTDER